MVNLNFEMQGQEQNQWCWSACSTSIAKYLKPNSDWTQCKVVNSTLNRNDCCQNSNSADCNKPWYLDEALVTVGHFYRLISGAVTFDAVEKEIDYWDCPIGVRIGWYGGGGHFVVITGVDPANNFVTVKDPWGAATRNMSYDTLRRSYQNNGTWTHTYTTDI